MNTNANPWACLRRAERVLGGLTGSDVPMPGQPALHTCVMSAEGRLDTEHLFLNKSSWRGGPLIGLRHDGKLYVHALRSGTPALRRDEPYALDASYMLGLSTMLQPVQIDWQGHWVMSPDNSLPDDETMQRWAKKGLELGLVDEDYPVLFLAQGRDGIEGWPLIWEPQEGTWRELQFVRS